jgi:hypothetical protein
MKQMFGESRGENESILKVQPSGGPFENILPDLPTLG